MQSTGSSFAYVHLYASLLVELIGLAVLAVSFEQVHSKILWFQKSSKMSLLLRCAGDVTLVSEDAQSDGDRPKAVSITVKNFLFFYQHMIFEQITGV